MQEFNEQQDTEQQDTGGEQAPETSDAPPPAGDHEGDDSSQGDEGQSEGESGGLGDSA